MTIHKIARDAYVKSNIAGKLIFVFHVGEEYERMEVELADTDQFMFTEAAQYIISSVTPESTRWIAPYEDRPLSFQDILTKVRGERDEP
jgi:hypothetical protein